jgi:hypothetical protein
MSFTIEPGITIGAGITITPSYSVVTDGLVFELDAGNSESYPGSGNNWYDLVGSADATLPNGATYSSSNGGILTFSRASQQSAHAGDLAGGALTTFTAETWVYFNTLDNTSGDATCTITEVYATTPINYSITCGLAADPTVWQGGFFDGGGWQVAGNFVPVIHTWYCMCVTFDGSNVRFYINGALNESAVTGSTPGSSGLGIHIGERWDAPYFPKSFLDGSVPVARLYNRGLSGSEVNQNFNALRGRYGV